MNALLSSTRAELFRLTRWPVLWVLLGVMMMLDILFGYVFNYLGYRSDSVSAIRSGVPAEALLTGLLPVGVPATTVAGMPMFGGAILLILGALTIGGGYGWGTWKTLFTQGPSRTVVYGGVLAALAAVVVAAVAVTFLVNVGIATLISGLESQAIAWPPAGELVRAVGGALLMNAMWTAAGVLAGTLARSPAAAVGLGLVWVLAVENLLRGVGNALAPVGAVADLLPGTAAGSLAGALGATAFSGDDGTPGVLATLDGGPAGLLLAGYAIAFACAAGLLVVRRDA